MNDRKRQVLLTAQRLFIEKGFSATSVQDILEESKISKGTFYNYFSSKNECLLAILEHIQEETSVRRRELLIGQSISNKDILAEQISIHMQISQEQNLLPLFEAIFHSGDKELRNFIKDHHMGELLWLSKRIIDIYGEDSTPYAPDCAVLLLGMLQHMTHLWMVGSKGMVDHTKLVHFIIRRMDSIVSGMIDTRDIFIGGKIFFNLEQIEGEKSVSKEQIIQQLTGFQTLLEDDRVGEKQYIQFLMDEINKEHPRSFLIETISQSFNKAFRETSHEAEAQEITAKLWHYMDTFLT